MYIDYVNIELEFLNFNILNVSKDLSIHFFLKNFEWLGSNMAPVIKRNSLSTNRYKNNNKMTKTRKNKNIKNIK